MSQNDPKTTSLMTSVTKNPHPGSQSVNRKKTNPVGKWGSVNL